MSKTKEFKQTELCEGCIFFSLCKTVDLPHCNGEDYVKEQNVQ